MVQIYEDRETRELIEEIKKKNPDAVLSDLFKRALRAELRQDKTLDALIIKRVELMKRRDELEKDIKDIEKAIKSIEEQEDLRIKELQDREEKKKQEAEQKKNNFFDFARDYEQDEETLGRLWVKFDSGRKMTPLHFLSHEGYPVEFSETNEEKKEKKKKQVLNISLSDLRPEEIEYIAANHSNSMAVNVRDFNRFYYRNFTMDKYSAYDDLVRAMPKPEEVSF